MSYGVRDHHKVVTHPVVFNGRRPVLSTLRSAGRGVVVLEGAADAS